MPKNYSEEQWGSVTEHTWSYDIIYDQSGPVPVATGYKLLSENTSVTPVKVMERSRLFTGTRTANYKTVRAQNGFLPTLPCTDLVRSQSANPATQVIQGGPFNLTTLQSSGGVLCGYPSDVGFPRIYLDKAAVKLAQKVADNDFNAAVAALEARKSYDFVVGNAQRYAKALRQFRQGKFDRALSTLNLKGTKGAASNWLSYKFGWMPLLLDAKSSAEYAARRVLNQTYRRKFMVRETAEEKAVEIFTRPEGWQAYPRADVKRSYLAKVWVVVELENPTLRAAAEAGLTNPLAVAWEVTPFSWVADYFLSIGDYLNTLTAYQGLKILDSGYSWQRKDSGTAYQGLAQPPRKGERSSTFNVTRYVRGAGLWSPLPSHAFHFKGTEDLNLSRLTNVAALIRQLHK